MNGRSGDDGDSAPKSWLDRLAQLLSREPRDLEELLGLLRHAEQRQLLDAEALSMIEGVMQVSNSHVREVMIPRAQMVVVERDWPLQRIVQVVVESGHSRLPVVGETHDQVEGILLAKDLLRHCALAPGGPLQLGKILRPAEFVPESKRLNVLLREFRTSRRHMVIVADEFGGVAGLVTIEDVLEEIVGEIDDEYDESPDVQIVAQADGQYHVHALTPIETFNARFGSRFSDQECDTIGGLVMQELGRLPKRGERVEVQGFCFTVLRADNRRIYLLGLTPAASAGAVAAIAPK